MPRVLLLAQSKQVHAFAQRVVLQVRRAFAVHPTHAGHQAVLGHVLIDKRPYYQAVVLMPHTQMRRSRRTAHHTAVHLVEQKS